MMLVGSLSKEVRQEMGSWRIARDSKGWLRISEKTVSIKVKLEQSTEGQLRDMAGQLDVPMASIIRQGIIKALEELSKEAKWKINLCHKLLFLV